MWSDSLQKKLKFSFFLKVRDVNGTLWSKDICLEKLWSVHSILAAFGGSKRSIIPVWNCPTLNWFFSYNKKLEIYNSKFILDRVCITTIKFFFFLCRRRQPWPSVTKMTTITSRVESLPVEISTDYRAYHMTWILRSKSAWSLTGNLAAVSA